MPEKYRIRTFCSHFYWLFACIGKQILLASIFRQLCLQKCDQGNYRLSWWKTFWRLDNIDAVLRQN